MSEPADQGMSWNARRIAFLAVLTAMCSVGRWVFALPFLPNIQPFTVCLMIITLTLGTIDGLIVANLSVLLTNLLLGSGPWTLHQMLTYSILLVLISRMRGFYRVGTWQNRILFAIIALLLGFAYGALISALSVYFYQIPQFLPYYLAGLPYDALHAGGNFIFYLILEKPLVSVIQKQMNRRIL